MMKIFNLLYGQKHYACDKLMGFSGKMKLKTSNWKYKNRLNNIDCTNKKLLLLRINRRNVDGIKLNITGIDENFKVSLIIWEVFYNKFSKKNLNNRTAIKIYITH